MQIELKQIQQEVGITTVFVTHDQDEALSLCDRVAIFREGRIAQVGPPALIYERPGTVFVATFLGAANLFRGRPKGKMDGYWRMEIPDGTMILTRHRPADECGAITMVVRPEKMLIVAAGVVQPAGRSPRNAIVGRVQKLVYLGSSITYIVQCETGPVTLYQQNRDVPVIEPGIEVRISWSPEHTIPVSE
jgi:ABC-type Fe3+/spermidine/putrescine transport system ATPase subunit